MSEQMVCISICGKNVLFTGYQAAARMANTSIYPHNAYGTIKMILCLDSDLGTSDATNARCTGTYIFFFLCVLLSIFRRLKEVKKLCFILGKQYFPGLR